ncbi:MAG: putative DNA binding domain-containing protein [Gammaproteobacteria bacterium]|nr:putative DNA binding domain-containing protein [Gammaproteobacteria bacterium]
MCKKISELIKQPESKKLEFKRDLSSLRPIIKTIIAFANTAGGTIVVGIEDNGKVVGIADPLHAEEKIASAITDSIAPMLMPDIEIVTVDQNSLLVIDVPHVVGPYYLKQVGNIDGVLVRVGSTNRQASPQIIEEIKLKKADGSFDALPCHGSSKADFDPKLIDLLFENFPHKPTTAKLQSLGLLVKQGNKNIPSNAGIILLGNEDARFHKANGARVSCARFADTTKAEFIDRIDIDGGILTAIDEVPKFIRRNSRMAAEIKTMRRRDIPEYPTEAIREALINALLHSSYMFQGMRILVAIYSDRLDITNPGMFPVGIDIEDLKNGVSSIRNKTLAQIFKKMELVETWGSGYERISRFCKKEGYPEPKWEEFGNAVRVTFYPHPATITPGVKEGPSWEQVGTKLSSELTRRQLEILTVIRETGEISFRDLVKRLENPPADRTLRDDLAKLKQLQLIDSKGFGRGALWHPLVEAE